MNSKALKQQSIVEQIIKVLAENQVTFEEAPDVFKAANYELTSLSQKQTIQVPSN